MSNNGNGLFREDELVNRKIKVGQEWQNRVFPIIAGRLRILHENNDHLSIQTEIAKLDSDFVVVKATVECQKGKFNGTGTASGQRDSRLSDSLVELAETRAIARALRFGGIGVEYTSAEEVSHVASAEPEAEQTINKKPEKVFDQGDGNSKTGTKASSDAIDRPDNGSKPQHCGKGTVTSAQVRALHALTKRAQYSDEDIASLLGPLNASSFQELTRQDASNLIQTLQIEVAA
ncbi:hypothetical protein [Desulfomonile tiedjei]|uniref:Uncharacterized protein n=1 Tax=Desulfomonile tiedjei (strain ATCC 49306 / DSM 6799 / DCB-1) TaxID=706587 RepID=I4C5N4_DESTA|nr:hypothetical protein [Desulfomonile tiedjei]AFM24875.1 hypothetical protein Desti_2181 [Desulfomonile tiedjei DSM 6799]